MAGKRKSGNKDLPPNLYKNGAYFIYIHPGTKKRYSLGRDKARAVSIARKLNDRLLDAPADPVDRILGGPSMTVSAMIDRFEVERLPDKQWRGQNLENMKGYLRRYRREFGGMQVRHVTVKFLADWLKKIKGEWGYKKHRDLLIEVFQFARSQGLIDENTARETQDKKPKARVRKRLKMEQYRRIYDQAEPWLQVAMDFLLVTLLRPCDAVRARFDMIRDGEDGRELDFGILSKTKDYNNPIYLVIEIPEALDEVISRARQSGIVSPFILHRRPRRKTMQGKTHWTQIDEGYLSRAFREAREAAGIDQEISNPKERPTLYEIRSLGSWLYSQQGVPEEEVSALMGHSSVKMTKVYQGGHEVKKTKAKANLDRSKA